VIEDVSQMNKVPKKMEVVLKVIGSCAESGGNAEGDKGYAETSGGCRG